MPGRLTTAAVALLVSCVGLAVGASVSHASAPPIGPLPAGPRAEVQTQIGELVAFALPHRSHGRVWRIANSVNSRVLRQVSEADVGNQVVLVFKAAGLGTAEVAFALTRGETWRAFESRHFTVTVRS